MKSLSVLLILILITIILSSCTTPALAELTVNGSLRPPVDAGTVLSSEQLQEDFTLLVNTLSNVHPATLNGFTELQKGIIEEIYGKIVEPMTVEDFYLLFNKLVVSFKDIHTNASFSVPNGYAEIPVEWFSDGLYVIQDTDFLAKRDKIVRIGHLKEQDLLNGLKVFYSAENDYWLKRVTKFFICQGFYLKHLGVVNADNTVPVEVLRDNTSHFLNIPISSELELDFSKDLSPLTWDLDLDYSLGILTINESKYDEDYERIFREFFSVVASQEINNIVFDLRNNSGGTTNFIRPLFSYLDFDDYYVQGSNVRFSKEIQELGNYEQTSGIEKHAPFIRFNNDVDDSTLLFSGNIFVLIAPTTMSSASNLALIFKDNQLGTLIGEPTGQKTHRYGDAAFFYLPNSGIRIQVSHKQINRPNANAPEEDAVYPDVLVNITIDDIINGNESTDGVFERTH